jgi:hypothetical protein
MIGVANETRRCTGAWSWARPNSFQCQRKPVAVEPGDIAAPHQAVEHAIELVGAADEPFGHFCLREAAFDARQ